MNVNNKTELLQKLKVLADRGVGGEKENAAKMLNKLMKKYGISEAELSEDKIILTEFKYRGEEQKQILLQIVYKVTNRKDPVYEAPHSRTVIFIDVTAAEKIEVEFLFDFYVKQYEKERNAFLHAFIQKHKLFGNLKPDKDGEEVTFEEILKMNALMNGMEDVSPVRRLERS